MYIKSAFSIKDLENLTGVKAHTIRIWEKRYNLLAPDRSETNIRSYSLESLQKLLNIYLLNKNGIKISKIAEFTSDELITKVREISMDKASNSAALNSFKLAMVNYDQALFESTYNQLLAKKSFREVFLEVFIDLLTEIGILWTTNSISPAQEHFISTLIKQKLLVNIERFQNGEKHRDTTFIMYLPDNEIHDLGLLYIHFELLLNGFNSIYLGPSVPIADLIPLQSKFKNVRYISYFTVEPPLDELDNYIKELNEKVLSLGNSKCICLGRNALSINKEYTNIIVFERITDFLKSEEFTSA
jgi:DNA-binding transcriptional MerR regulator